MVGEVVLGGIQTADAIAGLTTTVIRVVKYCRRLKAAPELAKGVLDRIDHWEGTLESITHILEAREQHVVPQLPSIQSLQFENNVKLAIERCTKTLDTIDLALGDFSGADAQDGKLRYTLWVRGKLVSKQDDLDRLLKALDSHQAALKMALDILQWHDNHQILLDPAPDETVTGAQSCGFQAEIEANESLESIQETARQLVHQRPRSNDSTTLASEGRRDSCSASLALAPTHDLEALDHFVHKHTQLSQEHIEKAAKSGDYKEAKQNLVSAIKYAEQRQLVHGVAFDDRMRMHITLAQICRESRQWQEALEIVHNEVPEADSVSAFSGDLELYTAQRSHLLSSIYFDRYKKDKLRTTQQEDRRLADEHAKEVLAVWSDHSMLQPDQAEKRRDCLKMLVKLYEDQGENVVAKFYQDKLDGRAPRTVRTASINHLPLIDKFSENKISAIDALCQACDLSDVPSLESLIVQHEVPINTTNDHGTVLHYAATTGKAGIAELLLEEGADVNLVNEHGHTALSKAVSENHLAVVTTLLQWRNGKADATTRHNREGTVLHIAAKHKDPRCSELLLQHTPDLLNMKDRFGQTALHYAVHAGNLKQAELLLDKGIARNESDSTGRSPLSLTLEGLNPPEDEAMFNLLFNAGAIIGDTKLTRRQEFTRDQYLGAGEKPNRRATTAGRWSRFEQQSRADRRNTRW